MHRETPLIINRHVHILHSCSEKSSIIYAYYNGFPKRMDMRKPGRKITLLNGEPFDPKSMVSYDWRQIIPPNVFVDDRFRVHNIDYNKSKLLRLLEIPLKELPFNAQMWLQIPAEWSLMKCYLDDNGTVYDENGLGIKYLLGTVSIKRVDEYELSKMHKFDPDMEKQQWQIDTIKNIESLLEQYHNYVKNDIILKKVN